MNRLNVLVTGAGGPVGQSIMKAVQAVSFPCRLLATDRHPISAGFYWADQHRVLPSVEEPAYLEELGAFCRTEHVDAVLIGSEPEMKLLSRQKDAFERAAGTRVIVSSPDVLSISTDKWETVRFLAANDLPYPRSALPDSPKQVKALIADVGFPVIVKPRAGSGSKGLFKVNSRHELELVLQLVEDPVVQECLQPDDQEYTAAAFIDDIGQPQGAIVMRRELAAGLTYRAWVDDNPAVAAVTRKVAVALQPLGPCNVQLRLTDRGPVPFEINARFSSTASMRAHFGYNEVEMALRCYVLGEKITAPLPKTGIALRFWEEVYPPGPAESTITIEAGERVAQRQY